MKTAVVKHQKVAILDLLTDTAALLDGAKIDLYKSDTDPDEAMSIDDFEIADFSGYAQKVVATWGEAFSDGATGEEKVVATSLQWNQTADTVQCTVHGYLIRLAAGDLFAAVKFDEPVEMVNSDSSLPVLVTLPYGA